VKIDLLPSGKPIGTSGVDDLARPAVVRVIANILDKQVPLGTDVPFRDKRRFVIATLGYFGGRKTGRRPEFALRDRSRDWVAAAAGGCL
jgi:hypothetical protein